VHVATGRAIGPILAMASSGSMLGVGTNLGTAAASVAIASARE
jgi:hypothetical protein